MRTDVSGGADHTPSSPLSFKPKARIHRVSARLLRLWPRGRMATTAPLQGAAKGGVEMKLIRAKVDSLDLSLGRLRLLPERSIAQMARSLRAKGQLSPVVAAEEGDRFVLVDGFARALAAKRVGIQELLVETMRLTGPQMKAQMLIRNRERTPLLVEEFRIVRELVEVDGLSQVEVADQLERHKSWVCRRLAMVRRLSPELLGEAELGQLSAGSLSKLAELPVRNQEQVWAAAHGAGLPGRDVGVLATLWRQATDPSARSWLLKNPAQALACFRNQPDRPTDPHLGEAGDALRRVLGRLGQAGERVTVAIEPGMAAVTPDGVQIIRQTFERASRQVHQGLLALATILEERDE